MIEGIEKAAGGLELPPNIKVDLVPQPMGPGVISIQDIEARRPPPKYTKMGPMSPTSNSWVGMNSVPAKLSPLIDKILAKTDAAVRPVVANTVNWWSKLLR